MNFKGLMSIKNSKVLVKELSYEGAEELLMAHIRHLRNETAILRESYNETVYMFKNRESSSDVQLIEQELEASQNALKEKLQQLNHMNSLLEGLHEHRRELES